MFRLLSILIVGVGGYWVMQNRFRVINTILSSSIVRRFFVSSLMSIPFIRQQMMKTVFPGQSSGNQY